MGRAHCHTQAHGTGKDNAIRERRQTENIEVGLRMPPERTGLKIHAILGPDRLLKASCKDHDLQRNRDQSTQKEK